MASPKEYIGMAQIKSEAASRAAMKRIDELIKSELEGLEITQKYLGKLLYARSLATLGGCSEMKEDYENSVGDYLECGAKEDRTSVIWNCTRG